MGHFAEYALQRLNEKKNLQQLRSLKIFPTQSEGFVDFSSNDYLGFATSPDLIEKFKKSIEGLSQLGSTGSRLLSGHHQIHEELEKKLSHIFKSEDALFFSSGHQLNMGLINSLGHDNSVILLDELCHNSLRLGVKLSKAPSFLFRHNDLIHLRERLQTQQEKKCFIVVESVYSMDGDLCPLQEICDLAEEFNAEIILDEAHASGVLGTGENLGLGLACELGLENKILARVVTLGKAFGAEGAFVLGSVNLKNFLVNFCPTFIYTTGPSFPMIKLASVVMDNFVMTKMSLKNPITKLHENIHFFNLINKTNFHTPIIPFKTKNTLSTIKLSDAINSQGFKVFPIFPPTVKKGEERIRIIIHAFNTFEEIKKLSEILMSESWR
jgi:8-amino-7-oxononanoate synthase